MRQSQLDLLRKLVDISNSLADQGASHEFLVSTTMEGTDAAFLYSAADTIDGLNISDIRELHSRGLLRLTGGRRGTKNYEVTSAAFEMFRVNAVPDHVSALIFKTGDSRLDELLDSAVTKYKLADSAERQIALEKLWDAWERLKTLESDDKRVWLEELLGTSVTPAFLEVIETEAKVLTDLGNQFHIRHHEKDRHAIADSHQADYFFERMFSLIRLVLRKSGRV